MKKLIISTLMVVMLGSLAACQEGTFEKMGRKSDNAAKEVKNKTSDYARKASDKIHGRGPAQKVGNKADKHLS